jgi:hypothetical protein
MLLTTQSPSLWFGRCVAHGHFAVPEQPAIHEEKAQSR